MTDETRFGQWFNGLHLANGHDEKSELSDNSQDEILAKVVKKSSDSGEESDEAFVREELEDQFPVDGEPEVGRHKLIRKSSLFEDDGHKILEELVHGIPMKQKDKFVKVVKKFLR